jgi:L-alanine-DL-glutamate epimerase-like enolase superfamily enzyme
MKIVKTEIFVLADPPPGSDEAGYEMPSPGAWPPRIRELACLRIHTDAGVSGLSEIFAVPGGVAKAVLDGPDSFLGRHLIGEDPIPPERLWRKLYNTVLHSNRRGWEMICIGAVDVALWDIFGKVLRRPVWQLLGGSERANHQVLQQETERTVVPYCTIVSDAWDRDTVLRQQIDRLEHLRSLGFRGMKIEPMRSTRDTIVELTRRAREALGSDGTLCIDVGMMWNDLGAALDVIERVKEQDVYFFETPFPADNVDAYTRITERSPIRIAAGEHSVSRWEFFDLMDRGGLQVVQPYVTTVGGLSEAKHVVEHAESRGALVIPRNWSTQILGSASVHLALWSPISPFIEYTPADIYPSPLRREIQRLGFPVLEGRIAPPATPGIGIELTDDLIAHFRVA